MSAHDPHTARWMQPSLCHSFPVIWSFQVWKEVVDFFFNLTLIQFPKYLSNFHLSRQHVYVYIYPPQLSNNYCNLFCHLHHRIACPPFYTIYLSIFLFLYTHACICIYIKFRLSYRPPIAPKLEIDSVIAVLSFTCNWLTV